MTRGQNRRYKYRKWNCLKKPYMNEEDIDIKWGKHYNKKSNNYIQSNVIRGEMDGKER